MSTAQVVVPVPMAKTIAVPRPRLASIKIMFNSNTLRRHIASQLPSPNAALPSLFLTGVPRRSMEKAAERDWQEQAKEVFQLSTVNDRGTFLPPTPVEQSLKERFKDNDQDYFATITSTSPEKVRTFLSTESTISPGMFSLPSNKIKRHTIPSFTPLSLPSSFPASSAPPSPTVSSQQDRSSNNRPWSTTNNNNNNNITAIGTAIPASIPQQPLPVVDVVVAPVAVKKRSIVNPADTLFTPPASPPSTPAKNMYFEQYTDSSYNNNTTASITPEPQEEEEEKEEQRIDNNITKLDKACQIRKKRKAQISFLTGAPLEDDLSDALSELLNASMPSSPPGRCITSGSDSGLGSEVSSPGASPRPSVLALQKEQVRRINTQKLRAQNNFGGELRFSS
ncbi:hypothetical protein BG011_006633 [Mortierella polycephala]|uniref:Uncharacterized protein n=1 Tax=Mortierella polycephala TaxID=41804 RepID=A0A9P6PVH4_9FUNG|nr:hypothetical protein BG011_006633 [Mortierella polycephala]